MRGWAIAVAAMLLIAALPLASNISPAHAAFGAPKNLSNSASDSALSSGKGSQIAYSNSTVYVVWEEFSDNDIYFARSADGGSTFGSPVNLSNDATVSTSPQIATVGSNVYVIWLAQLGGGGEIWFTRSTDSGASFDSPVKLSGTSATADNPRMAAESTYVYVAWDDPASGNHDVYVRVGTGSGAVFGTAVNVSSDSDESTLPSIATVGFNVYVAWRSVNGTDTFVFYNRSTDRGLNYGTTENLGDSSGATEGPEVAATGADVHVTWLDDGPGNVDTFHRFSSNSGASFLQPRTCPAARAIQAISSSRFPAATPSWRGWTTPRAMATPG